MGFAKLKAAAYRLLGRAPWLQTRLRDHVVRRRLVFPQQLSVEVTNACNAKCVMCPRDEMQRPVRMMTEELFERIVDEAKRFPDHLRTFQPFAYGESLLHPKLPEFIAMARRSMPRTRINLSTNGQTLTSEVSSALLDAGLDALNVDIDGASAEIYETIRLRLSYDTVVGNLEEFLRLRALRPGRHPKVTVTMIRMTLNEHEEAAFQQRWRGRVDRVQINRHNTWIGNVPDRSSERDRTRSSGFGFTFPCDHLWRELVVAVDGRVGLCCLDFDVRHVVGYLDETSLQQIWQGPGFDAVRELFMAGNHRSHPLCSGCNAHIFQQDKWWAALWPKVPASEPRSALPTGVPAGAVPAPTGLGSQFQV